MGRISFCGKKPLCVCIPLTGHGSKLVHKMLFESWVYYNRYNTAGKIFKTPCLVINLLDIIIFILAVYYRHNVCFVCMFLVFFYLADNEYKEHQLLEEVKRINNHKVCCILPLVR